MASTPGEGSTFTLYLPLKYRLESDAAASAPRETAEKPALKASVAVPPPVTNDAAAQIAPQAAAGLMGKKVLVVDDDIRNVFALTSALETHGMKVLHAESGKEGIELLKRSGDVDLVLTDVMMPGLDGIDTMRIVRKLDGYGGVPIIAVTAKAMSGDREKCLEAGATDYIAKPVNMDVLLATLWRSVQRTPHTALQRASAPKGRDAL